MPRRTTEPKPLFITLRLSEHDGATLAAVRRQIGGTRSDALRFALKAAARELVEPTSKRKPMEHSTAA